MAALLTSAEMLPPTKCLMASITVFTAVLDRRPLREPLPPGPEAQILLVSSAEARFQAHITFRQQNNYFFDISIVDSVKVQTPRYES